MTSQVILINSYGVAIASDSAVTTNDRVHNGVDKIIPLPSPHKIAFVISNSATFMGVPWESVVQKWAEEITQPLESLPLYWSSLSKWLSRNLPNLQSVKGTENNSIYRTLRLTELSLYQEKLIPFLHEKLGNGLEDGDWSLIDEGKPTGDLVSKINLLLQESDLNELLISMEEMNEKAWDELGEELGNHYGEVVSAFLEARIIESGMTLEEDFATRWPHAAVLLPYLLEQAPINLSIFDEEHESVICIAGYGSNDLFPSLLRTSTYQMFGGKIQEGNFSYCEPGPYPQFLFLGQKDALENLMYGYDSTVEQAFISTEQKIFEMKDLIQADSTNIRDYIQRQADNSENRLKITERSLEAPLYRLIASSPLNNLGLFAGSLVSIQAAFATITQPIPTVGGDIDIATINLGSGFSWIRHEK